MPHEKNGTLVSNCIPSSSSAHSLAAHTSNVPFFGVDREYRQIIDLGIADTVRAVLCSGAMLQGAAVTALEKTIAGRCKRLHGIAVGSGTDGLFFALHALGIGVGDEVLVPDFSFVASASAVLRTGAKPVFVDVDEYGHVDWHAAQARLSERTKALVAVHLFGGMVSPLAIEEFRQLAGVYIVEDFAQSLGAESQAACAGSIGDVAVTSFDPTKILSSPGSGGMVVCDREDVAQNVRRQRLHGMAASREFAELGYNSQLPTIAASILLDKLQYLDDWAKRRSEIADYYIANFKQLPLQIVEDSNARSVTHVRHKFVIKVHDRDGLQRYLTDNGVETRVHYARPLHREPVFHFLGEDDRSFPKAIHLSQTALSLPIHAQLTDVEVDRVVDAVKRFFHSAI